MNNAKKNFDDFTWQTRVMPVLVIGSPILISAVAKGLSLTVWTDTISVGLIVIIILSFFYRFARNMGKLQEIKITEELGAKPSVIILRFSDSTIGIVSKQRYHKRLNDVYGLSLPIEADAEQPEDDAQYDAAIQILKNRANFDRSTEFRVYQELKEYHFFRNLYGIKWVAFVMYVAFTIREYCLLPDFSAKDLFLNPIPDYISFWVFVVGALLSLLITRKGVQERSFSYAKALVETCERI